MAWTFAIESRIAGGDHAGAVVEATRFEAWLQSEERDPDPSSRAILRLAKRDVAELRLAQRDDGLRSVDLVGREIEFAAILDAWRKAGTGKTQLVQVVGPAGLGKTRLLEDVANRLRANRHRVVSLRAYPGERDVPYAFLASAISRLARMPGGLAVPATIVPTLLSIDARLADQYSGKADAGSGVDIIVRRSLALQEVIAAVSDEKPVAIFMDDLHWADSESRAVISSALAHVSKHSLLVVLSSRGGAIAVGDDADVTTISLTPLPEPQVRAMIAAIAAFPVDEDWPDRIVHAIAGAAGGSPLLVLEAAEQLIAKHVVSIDQGVWKLDARLLSKTLFSVANPIEARLRALSQSAFSMLTACSVSGIPVERDILVKAIQCTEKEARDALLELERHGHVSVFGDEVEVAHDSIAETALSIAEGELVSAVRGDLGAALVAPGDPRWVARGIRHLIAVDRRAEAFAALRTLLHDRNRTSKTTRQAIADVLGVRPDETIVSDALRSLPLRDRMKFGRVVAAAAASATMALTFLAGRHLAYATKTSRNAATLEIVSRDDGLRARHASVALSVEGWKETKSLTATLSGLVVDTVPRAREGAHLRPGTSEWAAIWMSPDSGGVDVGLFGPGGFIKRLTRSRADEVPGSWSPDGKQIAIETSQFGDSGHKKIAILDLGSGRLYPLDTLHERQGESRWSPDGTRIAFVRYPTGLSSEICVRALVGTRRLCVDPHVRDIGILGWTDDSHLLAANRQSFVLLDFDANTGTLRPTGMDVGDDPSLSSDGGWLSWSHPAGRSNDILVASTADLSHPKRIVFDQTTQSPSQDFWRGPAPIADYLDSISIEARFDTITVGAPGQLRVSGLSRSHRSTPVYALNWMSLSPTIATIDSAGVLRPLRPGTVTIEASAGGWRTTRRSFRVIDRSPILLLHEDWSIPIDARWRPFGRPSPLVVTDSLLGPAFFNNGDDDYFSGAYTRQLFDSHEGLVLDAVVRMRVTRPQWQELQLGFIGTQDLARLSKAWGHVTGYLPAFAGGAGCVIAYPSGEGAGAAEIMSLGGRLPRRRGESLPDIGLGIPTRVRVQIFPDGRCGVAMNGMPIFLSPQPVVSKDSLIVLLQGSSVATTVLVGRLSVRKGVAADVDWRSLK